MTESATFEAARKRSDAIAADLAKSPKKYRMLTGDRPTGSLHVGHLFGSIENRVRLQNFGIESFVVIADYQVLTDRDTADAISSNVTELVLDYLAAGLDPDCGRTYIFAHSQIPALNQLLLPFLSMVTMSELDRNPTIREEIHAAKLRSVSAAMYTYPVHQAADILFCNSNIVPVGKDQLPHLELTRKIARRFNERFSPEPDALLSKAPATLGLDGTQKMSKSRGNAIFLKSSEEETAKLIKKAKTDSERLITYDPENRPEVANLIRLLSLVTSEEPESIAQRIGDKGSGQLKAELTDGLNSYLEPLRRRRREFADDLDSVRTALSKGAERASIVAEETLSNVRLAMNMGYSN